ncbi:MAG: bifunctional folylpolyglutamate synthase/dihydrofolate synthase [Candidatus Syntrophosphaera sp.]|nr:bifunctional folylpolyglutamate synthase/dihydrofolate synthase [Candidatus Syntrophosphaera sp.]
MQYQEFLDHIYRKYSGNVKLELDRMRNLLEEMGDPQNSLRGFHIAGTNGKGSVCATLEALCLAHGWHTGLNTSPHLIDYTERFRLDGQELPFERILETFHRYEQLFEKWDASFFEITTAIAFQLFKEEQVQTAVIEVGLGGRLDATNLFNPDVCAITTIGLDHVKTLGGTLELIAAEKAGITKPGIPLVLGRIEPGPRKVIMARARELQAPLYAIGKDFNARIAARRITGLELDYSFGRHVYKNLRTNLIGEHQAANVAVALTAFLLHAKRRGLQVSARKIRQALLNVKWRGRMQVLSSEPLIIADGAHNVQGVQALLATLHKLYPSRRFRFLISILADKNYKEMIAIFCGKAERVYVAQNTSDRAASLEEQVAQIKKHGVPYVTAGSVAEAFQIARSELGQRDILVCGGSLYTVGEVLNSFKPDPSKP